MYMYMHNRKRESNAYMYVILHSLYTSVLNPKSPYLQNIIILKIKKVLLNENMHCRKEIIMNLRFKKEKK